MVRVGVNVKVRVKVSENALSWHTFRLSNLWIIGTQQVDLHIHPSTDDASIRRSIFHSKPLHHRHQTGCGFHWRELVRVDKCYQEWTTESKVTRKQIRRQLRLNTEKQIDHAALLKIVIVVNA